jgi:hypothetical protein
MDLPVNYTKLSIEEKKKVRNEYIRCQGGNCMYCGGSLEQQPPNYILAKEIDWNLFPKGFLNYSVHLQHCHDTNMTEGAVHAYCNAVLWQYEGR